MMTYKLFLAVIGTAILPSMGAALTVTLNSNASQLANATLGANSGITIVAGSESLIGTSSQQGTYTQLSLPPLNPSDPTLNMNDGVVLTTGLGGFSTTTNTTNQANAFTPNGSYQPLVDLASVNGLNTSQYDSNVLKYSFTLDNPAENAVKATFMFATDEYPTQSVTDIMGIFINGVNFAFFPNGDLVSNQSGDPNNFFNDNSFGSGNYGIEWNGLTDVFSVTGLAFGNGAVNTIEIALADTSDSIFDSALFFSDLKSGTTSGGGGIDPTNPVPLPAAGWLLITSLGGLGALRRIRRKRS